MKPSVERGQIWKHATRLDGQARWVFSYFLILDIRDGTISDWEYEFLPLTPHIDNTHRIGYAYPLNHRSEWFFVQ
jgi:hypothetical protein